ncbi:CNP1-like family protein [Thiomonas sp.]|uniref:CNP1-like uncharacterized domain-containing protein n=1 Tax=mine drainage metagenome TaxID=410659 RepID=E6PVP1_9ZZZZ
MIAAIAWKPQFRHTLHALSCGLLLGLAAGTASAQSSNGSQGLLEPSKPQATVAPMEFPMAPQDNGLQKVAVTGGSTLEFFVDLPSISLAGDALVRYTLVARSPQGPSNISYEGLDCAQDSWHIYGVWSASAKRWVPNPSSDWRSVNAGGFTRIHAVLDTDYLCKGRLAAGSSAEMVARLKQGIRTVQPTP